MESITARLSLKVQHLEIAVDTKSKDNVFVNVKVAVQYAVIPDKVPSAYYKLSDPKAQIKSYVYGVVRSEIPRMELDHAFQSKDQIANAVKHQLCELMLDYGYDIIGALVVDIDPDRTVKAAMNEINAAQRLREAANYKADADKILQVKAAEADAESKYLAGVGVSKQRKAIVDGMRDSVQGFGAVNSQDVMDLLLITQYFDMIRDMGTKAKLPTTLFLPHGPDSVGHLRAELKNQFASKKK